jgi:hypothetical protein
MAEDKRNGAKIGLPIFAPGKPNPSEGELQPELDLPPRQAGEGLRDHSGAASINLRKRRAEVGSVGNVEELRAELQVALLAKGDILDQR